MIFKNLITLYKTPLDSEYRNVYDDYETEAQYTAFLNFSFTDFKVISFSNPIVSRKNVGDLFEIAVNGYDSIDLHDYNYMRFITSNNEVKFAFILSVESYNDNQSIDEITERKENASCLLHCKLDGWANHYLELKNSYSIVNCKRATIDTNKYPNLPSTFKSTKIVPKKRIVKFLQSNNDTYCVLWQRCTLASSPNGATDLEGYVGTGGSSVMFRPSAILKNVENTMKFMKDGNIVVKGRNSPLSSPDSTIVSSYCIGIPTIEVVQSSWAISNTLTYTVPFSYTIEETDDGFEISIDEDVESRTIGDTAHGVVAERTGTSISTSTIVSASQVSKFGAWFTPVRYIDLNEVKLNYKQGELNYVSAQRNIASKDIAVKNEILFNEYPFHYYSIYIGAKEIPLLGFPSNFYIENDLRKAGLNINIDYDFYGKYGACVRIYYDNEDNFICVPIESMGEMDIKFLPYDEYMMRNQSAFTLSVGNGILKAITGLATTGLSIATGNPFGAVAGLGATLSSTSVLADIAKINDLKNSPASINTSGIYPQTSPYQLDLICIVENITNYDTEDFNDNLIYIYHCFGDDSGIIQNILSHNRDYFDYEEGECLINARISEEDKQELRKAIERGITRWHLGGSFSSGARRTILSELNRDVTNYPISLIP